jgi:NADH-quinone oxidoreductase subunit H
MPEILTLILTTLLKIIIAFAFLLFNAAYLSYVERKVIGHMQVRLGPMRTGPHGILQPIADGIKLFFKEDIIPSNADKPIFYVAPVLSIIAAIAAFAVIPLPSWRSIYTIADLNIGVLYLIALSSIGSFGIILGGWASNSKYALLGGLRASAQIISYEIAIGLSLVSVMLLSGSANLYQIVKAQQELTILGIHVPGFVVVQPVAFVIFVIAAVAESNRTPFDMPECESELVAGFFTEYSGYRMGLFFMAEYIGMVTMAALMTICFFGGWHGFDFGLLPPVVNFLIKVYVIVFCYIWIRATLPRVRYDQLMNLGWKILIPLALVNILATTFVKM